MRLVRLFGAHNPPPYSVDGSVVVASIQKLYSRLKMKDNTALTVGRQARVAVLDEAHKALAPSYRFVLDALRKAGATVVGSSATPGRGLARDAENRDLASYFGGRLIQPSVGEDAISDLQAQGVLAVVRRRSVSSGVEVAVVGDSAEELSLGFDYGTSVLKNLARSRRRNRLLVDLLVSEVHAGNPCLVFACTREHARVLAAAAAVAGLRAGFVDGEMDRADRRFTVEAYRRGDLDVLTNFGVLTTGFDAPRTRTVIIARPTTSAVLYGQMIGRALRGPRMGGGESATVIDVEDNFQRFGTVEEVYRAFEDYWGSR